MRPMKNKIYPYLVSIALVIIVTLFGALLRKTIASTNIVIFYLLIVVMTAVWWGRGPAVMISFLRITKKALLAAKSIPQVIITFPLPMQILG